LNTSVVQDIKGSVKFSVGFQLCASSTPLDRDSHIPPLDCALRQELGGSDLMRSSESCADTARYCGGTQTVSAGSAAFTHLRILKQIIRDYCRLHAIVTEKVGSVAVSGSMWPRPNWTWRWGPTASAFLRCLRRKKTAEPTRLRNGQSAPSLQAALELFLESTDFEFRPPALRA